MITILGATGNVGGKLVSELLKKGHSVRAVARNRAKLEVMLGGPEERGEARVGDISDPVFLKEALKGSSSAFVMIPPDYRAPSLVEHYRKISKSIEAALEEAGVPKIVNLSSIGAELPAGTGPIKALHEHEERLNSLQKRLGSRASFDILHLRPGYFMENLLMNVPLIQAQGIMGSAIRGDTPIPMIATQDIAVYAARRLEACDFQGISHQLLLGERDLTLDQAAKVVSAVLRRDIPYVQFDFPAMKTALKQMGFSEDTAEQFAEMSDAFNRGRVRAQRTAESTTPTRLEEFAQIFKQALAGAEAAA